VSRTLDDLLIEFATQLQPVFLSWLRRERALPLQAAEFLAMLSIDPPIRSLSPNASFRSSWTLEGVRSFIHSSLICDRHQSTSTVLISSLLSSSKASVLRHTVEPPCGPRSS